jgi:hypothetical protein
VEFSEKHTQEGSAGLLSAYSCGESAVGEISAGIAGLSTELRMGCPGGVGHSNTV